MNPNGCLINIGGTMITVNQNNSHTKAETQNPCLSLRLKGAAAAMGISERALWTLTDKGEVPCVRLGKMRLYPVDVLRDWLRQKAEVSTPEK